MEGIRLASILLPVPGGPMRRMLWPPAAATSMARLAFSWPRTSAKSGTGGAGGGAKRSSRAVGRGLLFKKWSRISPAEETG